MNDHGHVRVSQPKLAEDRRTPHVAIFLVTIIPMLVLVAVRGDVNTLGDMYAFGLLGAFTLTCVARDVIRYRERHGAAPIRGYLAQDALAEHVEAPDAVPATAPTAQPDRPTPWLPQEGSVRSHAWYDAKYILGVVTTVVVGVAWATNLVAKPLATAFGGSLTLLGVAIAVVYYHRQRAEGKKPVFPPAALLRMARSRQRPTSPCIYGRGRG